MQFHIENMTCDGCARSVAKAIQLLDASAKVSADPPNRIVEVESTATRGQIEAALQDAGFPPGAG